MYICDTFYSLLCSPFFTFCLLSQPFVVAVQRFTAKCPAVTLTVLCSLFFTCLLIHPLSPHRPAPPPHNKQVSKYTCSFTVLNISTLHHQSIQQLCIIRLCLKTLSAVHCYLDFGVLFFCLFHFVLASNRHMQFRYWQFICLFVLFWQVITHMFKSSAHQHFQAQKSRTKQNALIWWSQTHCKNTKIILKYCTKYPTAKLMAQNIA